MGLGAFLRNWVPTQLLIGALGAARAEAPITARHLRLFPSLGCLAAFWVNVNPHTRHTFLLSDMKHSAVTTKWIADPVRELFTERHAHPCSAEAERHVVKPCGFRHHVRCSLPGAHLAVTEAQHVAERRAIEIR